MSMPDPFFSDFLIIIIVATLVAFAVEKVRLPAILGFLLAGVMIGPNGLGFISSNERIHDLAEVGVILLMLTIGLEFSFKRLKGLGQISFVGGMAQLLISIGLGMLTAVFKGWTLYQGFVLGSVIALSSTAIIFKYLIDRGEVESYHGRISVAILLFQDFAVAPLIILMAALGAKEGSVLVSVGYAFGKALLLIGIIFIISKYIISKLIHEIVLNHSREIFFLSAVIFCFGIAWISAYFGLSFAIGAFFAGVMFANTDYGSQLIGDIVPFRHIFVSIFFVSIGLLFDIHFTLDNIFLIASMVGLVIVVNAVIISLLILILGYPPRIAIACGVILSQIGEFSFLLLETGRNIGSIEPFFYQVLLSTAFLTLCLSPIMFALIPSIMKLAEHIPYFSIHPENWRKNEKLKKLENHIILCGYGPVGTDLSHAFKEEGIPYIVIEMNPFRIDVLKKEGVPVIYGDAANEEVLKRAGLKASRALIMTFSDPIGKSEIIKLVQRVNPDVFVAVRTRYERDVAELYELGADMVVMEELEASYELNRAVLEYCDIHSERVNKFLKRIRDRKELMISEAILHRLRKP